ncbi:hypothetical protein LTR36_010869 [Oleoguttula mirabilis]|uniref:PCI domain-containing protein n=1 Tax=Oleoguttula mirabilis TaxID=1507867 RepID=A0AAV9J3R8_9PEZI|nr:hypothetical protein LTR36_010869 [Oleoguttula mirabilis]
MAANGIAAWPAKKMKLARSPRSGTLQPPTFDLDTWAGNYDGALLPLRLAHIAIHCPPLARQSLDLAISATKKGKDVQLYTRLCELAGQLGFQDLGAADQDWVGKQEEGNKRELGRLEGELRGYKNNLIRESIRMGQEDIATHLLLTGGPLPDPANAQSLNSSGYNAAYQAFGRMRDYCTTPTHIASMTLRLIYTASLQAVSAQQQHSSALPYFNSVLANAGRLRSVGVKEEEQVKLTPIASAAAGIAHLSLGNYSEAAATLLGTPFEYNTLGTVHGADFGKAMASANDLAIYGGLCALATYTRQNLVDKVLGGKFRSFLELEPHMRKAISLYTTAKYQACLATLRHYYSDWSLDIFLGAPVASGVRAGTHVDRLFARIREKSITAYLSSFSEVSLASLATTFPPSSASPTAMEDEVLGMIESGILDARLDVVNGILIAPRKETRSSAHTEAKKTAAEVERLLLLRLHKVNVAMAGLEIGRAKGSSGWESLSAGNGGY